MLAHREHHGPSVSVCIALAAIILALSPKARGICEPPIIRSVRYLPCATVQLEWFHPACFTDTVTAHKGPYAHPFVVAESQPDNRIALRLPACSSGALLHDVIAYFIAKSGVTPEAWSIQGSFAWSRHADSLGVPGQLLDGPVVSPIGEIATLRSGGWYTQPLDWRLSDSNSTWLVGSWPGNTQKIVRLAADAQPGSPDFLIGYSDNGSPTWLPYGDNGVLVKARLLYTDSTLSVSPAMIDSFRVERQILSGPMSPRVDSAFLDPVTALRWSDSTVLVGQTVRYSVSAYQGEDQSLPVSTDSVAIPEHWPVNFTPGTVAVSLASAVDTVVHASIANSSTDTLTLSLGMLPPVGTIAPTPKSPGISAVPDAFVLAPGQVQPLDLSISASDLKSGTYTVYLVAGISNFQASLRERHALPITLSIDQPTSVDDHENASGASGGRVPPSAQLEISAGPNPFRESITLTLEIPALPKATSNSHLSISDSPAGSIEVTVFNSLGNIMKREYAALRNISPSGESQETVSIPGTHGWPSGVYLVSVRYQGLSRTVKLLHLK